MVESSLSAEDHILRVAREARDRLDLQGNPELLRVGTNAVLRCGDWVIRIAPTDYDPELLDQQIDLASWLVKHDFPTSRPHSVRPLEIEGHKVSVWGFVSGYVGSDVDQTELGTLVRHHHELTNDYPGSLPTWEPLGRLGDRLDEDLSKVLSDDDAELLRARKSSLVGRCENLEFALIPGPQHGDTHSGNVISGDNGRLYLVDLDRIARGPREWDLVQPLAAVQLFGADPGGFDHFSRAYGWDVREWPHHDLLLQLRALFMTSWLTTVPPTDRTRDELSIRMRYWRGDGSPPSWSAA